MEKKYERPEIRVVEIDTCTPLAGSTDVQLKYKSDDNRSDSEDWVDAD